MGNRDPYMDWKRRTDKERLQLMAQERLEVLSLVRILTDKNGMGRAVVMIRDLPNSLIRQYLIICAAMLAATITKASGSKHETHKILDEFEQQIRDAVADK